MLTFIIILVSLFILLIIASITDILFREVPDWLSYIGIAFGILASLIFSIFIKSIYLLIYSLLGLALMFLVSLFLFYIAKFGGGDSKVLMAIGSIIGIKFTLYENMFFIKFIIFTIFASAVFGIFWMVFSILKNKKNRKEFAKTFRKQNNKKILIYTKIILILLFFISFFTLFFSKTIFIISSTTILFLIFFLYLSILSISVERSCMKRKITPDKLVEGDILLKDIKIGKEKIKSNNQLIQKDINKILKYYKKGKIKEIIVKDGIPFIPSFLIGLIAVTILYLM